jgi:hypothetical protein
LASLLQDEVASYLAGTPVEELDFVGVVERFDDDALRFARWLESEGLPSRRWRRPRDRWVRAVLRGETLVAPVANRNRAKGTLAPEAAQRIEEILADEMAIYQRALARSVSSRAERSRS